MATELLTLNDVSLCTDEGVRLCEGISFTLHEGEYMCVVGAGGCGKSILADTIIGVRKPLGGEIIYKNGLTRADIGFMPQAVEHMGHSVVRDIVLGGCLVGMKGLFVGRREKELAMTNLARLSVDHLA